MTNTQTIKISGMLNQHEFKERYLFTMQRIANGFSRLDLSFLLGRNAFDIIDYEQLSGQLKLNFNDHELMAALFKNPAASTLAFYSKMNGIDIATEKRMIRGTAIETEKERYISFSHPWKIIGENKPITITEHLAIYTDDDLEILEFVYDHLADLKRVRFFEQGCTALAIYHQLNNSITRCRQPMLTKILRQVVYGHIHSGEFQVHLMDGQVFYKIKK